MTDAPQTDPGFQFVGHPQIAAPPAQQLPDPLGPLARLVGDAKEATWKGEGFNAIWRPHPLAEEGQDRFLELNITTETLVFKRIPGAIPNRGLLMPDINMFGVTYMQQIAERHDPSEGLHIEPGIWANVPHTTNPAEPPTVVRMASIPHGTAMLAQGTGKTILGGPHIGENNIIPFPIGSPPPANSAFPSAEATFTELNLATQTNFRHESPDITQEELQKLVMNPNSFLAKGLAGKTVVNTTVLVISSLHTPVKGGGTANTAFLEAASVPPGGNAKAVEVDAIFWIEAIEGQGGAPNTHQLQYTQLVQLDFNGLRWPHVSVATLELEQVAN
ncbi:MAG: heme-binding protein [Solirubrobacteraceae bacterium]